MNNTIPLVEGIDLLGLDVDGVNAFFKTPPANGAGVAMLLFGDLTPGNANAAIVHGEPLGRVVMDAVNGNKSLPLRLAGLVRMTPYYDHRHSGYLQRRLVRAIAEARGMTAMDRRTEEQLEINEVPAGDMDAMKEAGDRLVENIDAALGYPVVVPAPASPSTP